MKQRKAAAIAIALVLFVGVVWFSAGYSLGYDDSHAPRVIYVQECPKGESA